MECVVRGRRTSSLNEEERPQTYGHKTCDDDGKSLGL